MSSSNRILLDEMWVVTFIDLDCKPKVEHFADETLAVKFYAAAKVKYAGEGRVEIEKILPRYIWFSDQEEAVMDIFFHDELAEDEKKEYESAISAALKERGIEIEEDQLEDSMAMREGANEPF